MYGAVYNKSCNQLNSQNSVPERAQHAFSLKLGTNSDNKMHPVLVKKGPNAVQGLVQ